MSELPTTRTSYVSRIGEIGCQAAQRVVVPAEVKDASGTSLVLRDPRPPKSPSPGPFWAGYRVYPAVLRIPGRRTKVVPVEVDLAPWSTSRTEVGLRFMRTMRPESRRRDFEAAAGAVEALVHALEQQAVSTPRDPVLRQVA